MSILEYLHTGFSFPRPIKHNLSREQMPERSPKTTGGKGGQPSPRPCSALAGGQLSGSVPAWEGRTPHKAVVSLYTAFYSQNAVAQ